MYVYIRIHFNGLLCSHDADLDFCLVRLHCLSLPNKVCWEVFVNVYLAKLAAKNSHARRKMDTEVVTIIINVLLALSTLCFKSHLK